MKNTFKKITASVMAIASLAVGMVGMSASAEDVTTPVNPEIIDEYQGPETDILFGNSAHAKAYADSSQVNLATEDDNSTRVVIKLTSAGTGTINDGLGVLYEGRTSVTHNYSGSNITRSYSTHTSKESDYTYVQYVTRYVG